MTMTYDEIANVANDALEESLLKAQREGRPIPWAELSLIVCKAMNAAIDKTKVEETKNALVALRKEREARDEEDVKVLRAMRGFLKYVDEVADLDDDEGVVVRFRNALGTLRDRLNK